MLQILCIENLFFKKYFFKNPLDATGLFLYILKTSENLGFSDIFREYRKSHELICGMKWVKKVNGSVV